MSDFTLPEFPSELALVIACSHWPLGERDEQGIRQRALAPLDWDRFLACVHSNQLAPLVNLNLRHAAVTTIPATVITQLKDEAAHNVRRALMQIAEAVRVARLLSEAGIRSLMIKGPVLSVLAFGDPTLRHSVDIDLLVDPEMVSKADRLIIQAGYRRVSPNLELTSTQYEVYRLLQCQFAYHSKPLDLVLELHWRLCSNSQLLPLEATTLWSRPQQVRVAGANVATLPDEELFRISLRSRKQAYVAPSEMARRHRGSAARMPVDVVDRISGPCSIIKKSSVRSVRRYFWQIA